MKPKYSVKTLKVVNTISVYEGKLNRFKILYSSEIDGIKEAQEKIGNLDLNDLTYVEIKLWNGWEDHRKYFQWWSQCRLANVEHLILGEYTKDEAGAQVNRLVEKNVQDFPNMKFGRKDCKVINDFFQFLEISTFH